MCIVSSPAESEKSMRLKTSKVLQNLSKICNTQHNMLETAMFIASVMWFSLCLHVYILAFIHPPGNSVGDHDLCGFLMYPHRYMGQDRREYDNCMYVSLDQKANFLTQDTCRKPIINITFQWCVRAPEICKFPTDFLLQGSI